MHGFFLKKNIFFVLKRFRFLCYYESTNFKIYSEGLLHRSYFRIVGNIKIKLGQIEVQLMTTISSLLCAQLWRLETSSRSVYNRNKMEIDSRWCLLFLMVSVPTFKRVKTTNSVWLVLIICVRLEDQRGPEYRIQSSKSCKSFLALGHIY